MNYFTKINSVRKLQGGKTQLVLTVDDDITNKINKNFGVELILKDKRFIRSEQRKKIYATIRDISAYTGNSEHYLKEYFKVKYCFIEGEKYFSLANCSVTTARKFINYLMEFVISEGIPLSNAGIERTDDIESYLYYCIKHRKCVITGLPGADIHHVDGSRIGMGGDRRKVNNANRYLIALSRKWHTYVHAEGEKDLFDKYKIHGIKVDAATLKSIGINAEDID